MDELISLFYIKELHRNIEVIGQEKCLRQAQEECTELATAISHFLRPDKEEEGFKEIIKETADMFICLNQVLMILYKKGMTTEEIKREIIMGMKKLKSKELYNEKG